MSRSIGRTEEKRIRERRISGHLKEVRRAVHDGEWPVALSETERLSAELAAIVDLDNGGTKYLLSAAPQQPGGES